MSEKQRNWSESRGHTSDMMHGLGSDTDSGDVEDLAVRRGIVLLSNCNNCGRQWKGLIPWGEVAMFFLGRPLQNVQATRQGILVGLKCNGGSCRPFTMTIDWEDVRRWVDVGIRAGSLDPKIKQAVRQAAPSQKPKPPGLL